MCGSPPGAHGRPPAEIVGRGGGLCTSSGKFGSFFIQLRFLDYISAISRTDDHHCKVLFIQVSGHHPVGVDPEQSACPKIPVSNEVNVLFVERQQAFGNADGEIENALHGARNSKVALLSMSEQGYGWIAESPLLIYAQLPRWITLIHHIVKIVFYF
jgi:hypothetical protein